MLEELLLLLLCSGGVGIGGRKSTALEVMDGTEEVVVGVVQQWQWWRRRQSM